MCRTVLLYLCLPLVFVVIRVVSTSETTQHSKVNAASDVYNFSRKPQCMCIVHQLIPNDGELGVVGDVNPDVGEVVGDLVPISTLLGMW